MKAPDTLKSLDKVRASLRSIPRLDITETPVELSLADGALTMEGEVADVAAKKLALEAAAAVPGITGIVDRLRVAPATPMGDKEIREQVRDALLQEPSLATVTLREREKGKDLVVRQPADDPRGDILVAVDDGVVTLEGEAPSLAHKRLAGVLAWWVPGSRDVINGLAVNPPEEDRPHEIEDAVRLVLEKDPFVNAGQIRVGVIRTTVTLTGLVPTESERDMAEFDAWYVFGVDKVVNRIEVRA